MSNIINRMKTNYRDNSLNSFIGEAQDHVYSPHHITKLRGAMKRLGFPNSVWGELLEEVRQRVAQYGTITEIRKQAREGTLPREDLLAAAFMGLGICKDATRMSYHEHAFESVMKENDRSVRKLDVKGPNALYVSNRTVSNVKPCNQKSIDYMEECDGYNIYYFLKCQNNQGGAQTDGYIVGVLNPLREVVKALNAASPHIFVFVNDGSFFTDEIVNQLNEEADGHDGLVITSLDDVIELSATYTSL